MAKKNKGTILTCGYYCLNSAVLELVKKGWRVLKLHRMENPALDGKVIDVSKELTDIVDRNAAADAVDVGKSEISNQHLKQKTLSDDEWMVLATFGIGGRQFVQSQSFAGLVAARLSSTFIQINSVYEFWQNLKKKYKDVKAILVHTAEGSTYRTLMELAKLDGIPTFCCLNGTISGTATKFAAHTLYNEADFYYLHGEYDVGYIREREIPADVSTYPIVGQPSFDAYYKGGKIKEHNADPNTFLYCCTVVCGIYHLPILNVESTVQMIDFSMFSKVLPPNNDGMFFEAFAIYQKEVNPDAKLLVSLRPYYNLAKEDFSRYLASFGIKNFEVYDHEEKPARVLISEATYLVSSESTLLIEGMLNRRGVVYLTGSDGGVGKKFKGTEEWAVPVAIDNAEAIVAALHKATETKDELIEACNRWAVHYNYNDDGKAGKRIAKDLDRRLS